MSFFKSTYSVDETVQLLNEYFSVKTFKTKDIIDLFFEGSLNLSLRCSFQGYEDKNREGFILINEESKEISCNISIYGIPSKKETISVSDGYAEITSGFVDGKSAFIGGGLFNISHEHSRYVKDKGKGKESFSLYIEQLGFIEYASMDVYPNKYSNKVEIVTVSFIKDYIDEIAINLSSVVIDSKSLLDCIEILQRRNESINYRLRSSSDKPLADKLQTENVELKSENKNLQERITELEKELQDRKNEEKNTQKIDKKNIFIKYLLAVNYGEDVANNPRSHILENDTTQGVKYANGAIQKSFELKGYKVPVSGRTLDKWTKDIKLIKQAS
ncbi:TPA: hypothetical protein QB653_001963 [Pasteurella multocida]|nr:hypothetical protein [Pasteurella multocida]